ncbi:WecB/TagA/CpsF family glycosyltransferase [bacterium]|nr:WecB/TagA/CpsF family glycosyltransferase [bacterium]
MLIVNADDLGLDSRTNAAIIASLERQCCSSATLMANMDGFEDACELVHERGLLEHVGIHVNLSNGVPLTGAIRRMPRFCDGDGRFRLLRGERVLRLSAEERAAAAAEIRAQIGRLKANRIGITHLDSHKNLHEEIGIFGIVTALAIEAGIPYVRRFRNIGWMTSAIKSAYRSMLNQRLERLGLTRTRYFGSIADYRYECARGNGERLGDSCEVMIHPCLDRDGNIIDRLTRWPLAELARQYDYPGTTISFSGHRYRSPSATERPSSGCEKERAKVDESKQRLLGPVRIDSLDMPEALARLDEMLAGTERRYVSFCDANLFVQAHRDPIFAEVLNRSGMTFADGVLMTILARLIGKPLPRRLPGPSFMLAVCNHGIKRGYRHFFFGGAEGVAQDLEKKLTEKYPGLIVAGVYTPPFRPLTADEEEDLRRRVREARPDLVWVGLGGPKQVFWMADHLAALDAPVMLGVGAAFDFHTGRVPWAPRWIRTIGMEWAYRMATGGRRVFRRNLECVPQAFLLMMREVWRTRL